MPEFAKKGKQPEKSLAIADLEMMRSAKEADP